MTGKDAKPTIIRQRAVSGFSLLALMGFFLFIGTFHRMMGIGAERAWP